MPSCVKVKAFPKIHEKLLVAQTHEFLSDSLDSFARISCSVVVQLVRENRHVVQVASTIYLNSQSTARFIFPVPGVKKPVNQQGRILRIDDERLRDASHQKRLLIIFSNQPPLFEAY